MRYGLIVKLSAMAIILAVASSCSSQPEYESIRVSKDYYRAPTSELRADRLANIQAAEKEGTRWPFPSEQGTIAINIEFQLQDNGQSNLEDGRVGGFIARQRGKEEEAAFSFQFAQTNRYELPPGVYEITNFGARYGCNHLEFAVYPPSQGSEVQLESILLSQRDDDLAYRIRTSKPFEGQPRTGTCLMSEGWEEWEERQKARPKQPYYPNRPSAADFLGGLALCALFLFHCPS